MSWQCGAHQRASRQLGAALEIKKAVTDEMAWFALIKANHYSKATPLGPWTLAEVGKITNFERTKCGIKF
jgi:hypothetical protein